MRRLICADLRRIFLKKSLYVLLAFAVFLSGCFLYYAMDTNWNEFNFIYCQLLVVDLMQFVAGLYVFRSVFADEFKVMAMITAIGRGLSRPKVVFAKLLDTAILAVVLNAVIIAICLTGGVIFGMRPDAEQISLLVLSGVKSVYVIIGFVSFSALVLYLSNNIPLATFAYICFSIIIPVVLTLLDDLPYVGALHLRRYFYEGLGDRAITDFMLGMAGDGAAFFALGLLGYVGAAVLITVFVFGKKELEF